MGSPILTTVLLASIAFVVWRVLRMIVIYWPDRYWPRENGDPPEPLHNFRVLRGHEHPYDWEAECPDLRVELIEAMLANGDDTAEFEVQRETIEQGKTFSSDAMDHLIQNLGLWCLTRAKRRWDTTGEPPTVMKVTITVSVQ